jgi:hypothetical protein
MPGVGKDKAFEVLMMKRKLVTSAGFFDLGCVVFPDYNPEENEIAYYAFGHHSRSDGMSTMQCLYSFSDDA